MGECFNCVGPASERYTLILAPDKILEDKLLCEECIAAFREVEWIEVSESPVLMRGGNDGGDDDQTDEE